MQGTSLKTTLSSLEGALATLETLEATYGERPTGLKSWLSSRVELLAQDADTYGEVSSPSIAPQQDRLLDDARRVHRHAEAAVAAEAEAIADDMLETHEASVRQAVLELLDAGARFEELAVLIVDRRSPGVPSYLREMETAAHVGPRDAITTLLDGASDIVIGATHAMRERHELPVILLAFGRVLLTGMHASRVL